MSKKKDENYYKKLYRKLKDVVAEDHNSLKRELSMFQHILAIVCKRNKNWRLAISLEEIRDLKQEERATRINSKVGSIIFEVKKDN